MSKGVYGEDELAVKTRVAPAVNGATAEQAR